MRMPATNKGRKTDGERTFTAAVKLPDESACIGVSVPIILTWSSVGEELPKEAPAAAPTFPPKILVLETMCSISSITIPKKRLSFSVF